MLGYGIGLMRYGFLRAEVARAAGANRREERLRARGEGRGVRSWDASVRDAGASALEWAIIAAVVVVAASIIGAVVMRLVQDKADILDDCANQPLGAECGGGAGGGAGAQ